MNASISKIDPSLTWEKLQHFAENQYFERKSARIQPKDIAHHISAMANASGGVVAAWVEERGANTGIIDTQENGVGPGPF